MEITKEAANKPPKAPRPPRKTRSEVLDEMVARHTRQQPATEPAKPATANDVAALRTRVSALEAELARIKSARSRAGRKPIGGRAMSAAERMRKMREKRQPS